MNKRNTIILLLSMSLAVSVACKMLRKKTIPNFFIYAIMMESIPSKIISVVNEFLKLYDIYLASVAQSLLEEGTKIS